MTCGPILSEISCLAREYGLSQPFLVGGSIRDILQDKTPKDFDITTGDSSIFFLAHLVSNHYGCRMQRTSSGTYKLVIDGHVFDFGNNYCDPDFEMSLRGETQSRDFTINSLLMNLESGEIVDYFDSIDDVVNRRLRAIESPEISFRDKNRLYRALDYISQGYEPDENIIDFIKNNPQMFSGASHRYAAGKINDCMRNDENFLNVLIDLGIHKHIPKTKLLSDILVKSRRLHEFI